MNILVTGVSNVIKDSVVKLALDRIGGKEKFKILSFSDFSGDEEGNELEMFKSTQRKLTENIQLKMLESESRHIVINGYCTVSTKLGYIPIISRESIEIFKPDIIILIETNSLSIPGKVNNAGFDNHKMVERSCSFSLSVLSGSAIKVIVCGVEGSRKGSEELFKLLKEVL